MKICQLYDIVFIQQIYSKYETGTGKYEMLFFVMLHDCRVLTLLYCHYTVNQ
jgi:hypothetical protein